VAFVDSYCFRIITYLDVTPSILFFLLDRIYRIFRIFLFAFLISGLRPIGAYAPRDEIENTKFASRRGKSG